METIPRPTDVLARFEGHIMDFDSKNSKQSVFEREERISWKPTYLVSSDMTMMPIILTCNRTEEGRWLLCVMTGQSENIINKHMKCVLTIKRLRRRGPFFYKKKTLPFVSNSKMMFEIILSPQSRMELSDRDVKSCAEKFSGVKRKRLFKFELDVLKK